MFVKNEGNNLTIKATTLQPIINVESLKLFMKVLTLGTQFLKHVDMLQMMTRFLFIETCECEKCLGWFIKNNYIDQKVWGKETKVGKGLF